MSIITLTTDLGTQDHYLPALKGQLLSRIKTAQIVDITHNVRPFDIRHAAFVLKNCYHEFPEGSIHVISVNAHDQYHTRTLAIWYDNHFFIGPDNGIFSLLFDQTPTEMYIIESVGGNEMNFPSKNIYAQIAQEISDGKVLSDLGVKTNNYESFILLQPIVQSDFVRGSVIYIDNYENVITNIDLMTFEQAREARDFQIYFSRNDVLDELSENYHSVPEGEKLCMFNDRSLLQISINKGNAAGLLGLKLNDLIKVEFV